MLKDEIAKAQILIEALPYIRRFQGATIIVKYGGSLMENDALKRVFAQDIALLKYVGMNPVVVHGGGKEISQWMKRLGKESVFIDGLRYTDDETMEVTEMVLSGKVNSEIVSLINASGGRAVGLSGKDANLFLARRIKTKENKDLGLVGDIDKTDLSLLLMLCAQGFIPVVSSVASSTAGETLNLNADYVAAGLAAALPAQKLIYLTDVPGIIAGGSLLNLVELADAEKLLKHPDVGGGMIPKLECSIRAVKAGVGDVHIIDGSVEHAVLLEIFTDTGVGTMIRESKRKAGKAR